MGEIKVEKNVSRLITHAHKFTEVSTTQHFHALFQHKLHTKKEKTFRNHFNAQFRLFWKR